MVKSRDRAIVGVARKKIVETVLMTSSIASSQMLSGLAQAQSADSGERQSQDREEIVVTVQKPASTVQTIPIAITAIDSQQIQRQWLTDFRGLSAQVPGASAGKSGNGRSDFVIRGLSDVGGTSPTRARPFDCDRHSPAQPRRDRTT
jgi:outer membrane receptor protein involved in Fe transport